MTLTLKDVNYQINVVTFETDDKQEVNVSFELLLDVNKYITGEWKWIPPEKKLRKKYRIAFKYRNDPWIFFTSSNGNTCKMGGSGEDVLVCSDDLVKIQAGLERCKYHACGMSECDIIQVEDE